MIRGLSNFFYNKLQRHTEMKVISLARTLQNVFLYDREDLCSFCLWLCTH